MKILTLTSAKAEIKRLQNFVDLVNSYKADTIDKWIIKEYAHTSSIREVVTRGREMGLAVKNTEIDTEYVKKIIRSKPKDELHRIIRINYNLKISKKRKKY